MFVRDFPILFTRSLFSQYHTILFISLKNKHHDKFYIIKIIKNIMGI
jgi:hypothetical protein